VRPMLEMPAPAADPFGAPSVADAGWLRPAPPRPRSARARAAAPARRLVSVGALGPFLTERLPIGEAAAAASLVAAGLLPAPLSLAEMARLFRAAGAPVPFDIARTAGAAIAVPRGARGLMTQIGSVAVRMVAYWGLASVRGVAERISALVGSTTSERVVGRVLAAMPRVRWLDGEERSWFSLDGDTGRFEVALRKIFAVAGAVPLDELRQALSRALPGAYEAPWRAFERCLVVTGGCNVDDGVVRRATPATAAAAQGALSPQEAALVDLIRGAGGVIDAALLRRRAPTTGVPKTTVNQLLRLSPLFVPIAAASFRLVGRPPGGPG